MNGRLKGLIWVLEAWLGREGSRMWRVGGRWGVTSLYSWGKEKAPWRRRMVELELELEAGKELREM